MMKSIVAAIVTLAAAVSPVVAEPAKPAPTIVLVHGAFAESASWNKVAQRLRADGFPVIAAANPLRGVESDAQYIGRIVASVHGPVVLVGHSYGGSVISQPAAAVDNVKALVYVAAFAPDAGEAAGALAGKFPGSTLGPTLAPPVPLADGSKDLYIDQAKFPAQFAADVPAAEAALMAETQRPIRDAALGEPSSAPAWKRLPSWFVYGTGDKNIPPAALAFMATRASAKKITVVPGASHVLMISHPGEVVATIEAAARN